MKLLAALALALATSTAVAAQESRATIIGRVTDPSGALVVGAKVRAINVETNTGGSSVSNEHGNYEIPYLLPGNYRVEVEMEGFKKSVRDGIELRVSDRMTLDFTLELGNLAESVVVTGETPLLESATASIGMIMDERRVTELPMVGGNPFYLTRLTPGLLPTGGRSAGNPMDQSSATEIVASGTRNASEAAVDGAPNMAQRNAMFSPPQDMVQEFKVNTATFDATLGHSPGAVTNVSMKAGTNTLHGTSSFFDSRIRAVPWFTNRFIYDPRTGPITKEKKERALEGWLHQHWGTTLSGPVLIPRLWNGRNKTFWTFGYEGLYIRRNLTFTGTVPTLAQRKGDFSDLLKLGPQYQIYDPATITLAAGGTRTNRLPLAGNIIPASRIEPLALKYLPYWPEPNQPGTADGRQNYFRTRDINRDNRTMVGRLDHNFRENHRVFVRLNEQQYDNKANTLPTIATGDITDRTAWGAVLDDVYVFSPQLLLNLRYGLTWEDQKVRRFSQGFDLLSLGFPKTLVDEIHKKNNPAGIAFPQITVDGLTDLGAGGGNTISVYYQTFAGTLTRITGNHSLRMGGEFRLMRENGYNFGNVAPAMTFSTSWTRGPVDNSPAAPIGQGFASFLFGLPTGGSMNLNASRAEQSTFSGIFIQDDWRVTAKLTLNIGLRYEYESPTTERFNRSIRGFDFNTPNPVSDRALANYARSPIPEVPVSNFRTIGGLLFVGVGGQPRGMWTSDKNNFCPRLGLAYQLTPKTVLRSGFGIFYDVLGIDRQDVTQTGFNQPTTLIPSTDNGLTFRATLANPFPDGIQLPAGASGGLATFVGRGVSPIYEKQLSPYHARWSMSVQRELPLRTVLGITYLGNRGNKLGVSRNLNPVPRQYLSTLPVRDQPTIDFLGAQVPNPFAGIPEFAGTNYGSNVRIARSNLLKPYPHFGDITMTQPIGYSWYHSLLVSAEKRLSKGFTFQAGWTYSKLMEAIDFLNATDLRPEEVVSAEDFTHRFVLSAIFELPFGQGKPLFSGAGPVLEKLVGGWQLQGWYEGQSGPPLGFGNAIFHGDLHNIELPVSQRRAERWFNTEAGFNRDNQQQLGSNIRTFPSRFNGVRADGINNFDLSLFKNFRVREGLKAQFRMEAFNALNHVQLGEPNTSPTSTAFGTITGEKGHGQRQLTFAVKLIF